MSLIAKLVLHKLVQEQNLKLKYHVLSSLVNSFQMWKIFPPLNSLHQKIGNLSLYPLFWDLIPNELHFKLKIFEKNAELFPWWVILYIICCFLFAGSHAFPMKKIRLINPYISFRATNSNKVIVWRKLKSNIFNNNIIISQSLSLPHMGNGDHFFCWLMQLTWVNAKFKVSADFWEGLPKLVSSPHFSLT